jgi:hypothetical protein
MACNSDIRCTKTLVSMFLGGPIRPLASANFTSLLTNHRTGSWYRTTALAKMTTSCLKVSKRQRVEMTGAVDCVSWTKESMATCSSSTRRSTKTQRVAFGLNQTIDFDSSLPACFIGLRSETRWSSESQSPPSSPRSQRRTICDTVPRLPNRDTLPRPPIRADAITLDARVVCVLA